MSYFSNKTKDIKVHGTKMVIVEWDELSTYLKEEVLDIGVDSESGCLHVTCKVWPEDEEAKMIVEELNTRD